MADNDTPRRPLDRLLLLEVALGLVLFGLAVFLYWIPASREPFLPRWWSVPLLVGLFFALLAVDRMRRRTRSADALHEVVDEVTREARARRPRRGYGEPLAAEETAPGHDVPRMDDEGLDPPGRAP